MPSIQLYISQAALKNAKDSKEGVDKEITSLQTEIEVNMPFFNILYTGFHICLIISSEIECKSWDRDCSETVKWSWIWSKSSSINDSKNDINSERNGIYFHSCRSKFVFISYLEYLLYRFFSCQEEVVLKRCWLARYWGLAAKYGKPLSVLTSFFLFF